MITQTDLGSQFTSSIIKTKVLTMNMLIHGEKNELYESCLLGLIALEWVFHPTSVGGQDCRIERSLGEGVGKVLWHPGTIGLSVFTQALYTVQLL